MVRIKHRYIICQILPDQPTQVTPSTAFTIRDVLKEFRDKIQILFGDVGAGDIGQNSTIKYFDNNITNIFVLRVPREYEQYACFALNTITSLKNLSLIIRVVNIAGCGRTVNKELQSIFSRLCESSYLSDDHRASLQQIIVSLHSIED